MTKFEVYEQTLGCATVEELMEDFLGTIAPTNRTYTYFVDWDKVRQHTERAKVQLNILNSLMDCTTVEMVEERFLDLIGSYPEVIEALPILIAYRDMEFDVLTDIEDPQAVLEVRFDRAVAHESDALQDLLKFCRNAGVFALFAEEPVDDLLDYVYGVEVGMDTHAHKNRSGTAMERLLRPAVMALCGGIEGLQCVVQCTAGKLSAGEWPTALEGRRMDFALLDTKRRKRPVDLETNYFGVSGSKPDVITGYIDRQRLLAPEGWDLILVTDGPGWRKMKNLLRDAFERLNYVMNLDQVRRGMLHAAIQESS